VGKEAKEGRAACGERIVVGCLFFDAGLMFGWQSGAFLRFVDSVSQQDGILPQISIC
jgi:hypothetical protein